MVFLNIKEENNNKGIAKYKYVVQYWTVNEPWYVRTTLDINAWKDFLIIHWIDKSLIKNLKTEEDLNNLVNSMKIEKEVEWNSIENENQNSELFNYINKKYLTISWYTTKNFVSRR